MKLGAATTLLFATLALAGPAPVAQPATGAVPALAPASAPVEARDAGLVLDARDPKKSKPKSSSSNNNSTDNAAGTLAPSRALELGVLGLGVLEVVRLWV